MEDTISRARDVLFIVQTNRQLFPSLFLLLLWTTMRLCLLTFCRFRELYLFLVSMETWFLRRTWSVIIISIPSFGKKQKQSLLDTKGLWDMSYTDHFLMYIFFLGGGIWRRGGAGDTINLAFSDLWESSGPHPEPLQYRRWWAHQYLPLLEEVNRDVTEMKVVY